MSTCGTTHTTQGGRQFVCTENRHPGWGHYFMVDNKHLESSLEEFFRTSVRAAGGIATKLTSADRGVPDRLVLLPGGRIYLVELKAENGSLSPIQKVWHSRAAAKGTHVAVLTGRTQVTAWLETVA